jgi:hypothetical protein
VYAAHSDYIDVISKVVVPAIPDFSWGHLTNADVDDDGFCIVTVKVTALGGPSPLQRLLAGSTDECPVYTLRQLLPAKCLVQRVGGWR